MDPGSQDVDRFWSSFGRDPRLPDNQGLRAGDRDRDIVREAITEAYADGRLTQDELDTRLTSVFEARLLGDLPPILADLMPAREAAPRQSLAVSQQEIERLALVRYQEQRRRALVGMLVPSLICLTVWVLSMVSTGGFIFPWPVFVLLGTGAHFSRLVLGRESAIEEERERLRKKRARQLIIEQGGLANRSADEQNELEAGSTADEDSYRQDDSDPERRREQWR